VRAWQPGNIVCDEVDEYYEPIDPKERALAAKITLTIRLAMHRAAEKQKYLDPYRPENINCRCVLKPITPDE
jgi:uncharacterized protein with gpF-like domain